MTWQKVRSFFFYGNKIRQALVILALSSGGLEIILTNSLWKVGEQNREPLQAGLSCVVGVRKRGGSLGSVTEMPWCLTAWLGQCMSQSKPRRQGWACFRPPRGGAGSLPVVGRGRQFRRVRYCGAGKTFEGRGGGVDAQRHSIAV